MRERSPYLQEQNQQRRKSNKFGKSNKKRRQNKRFGNGNNGNRAEVDGNRARSGQSAEPGVCIKCGHPAPDGKLCSFHRSLLNSIRNDFGDRRPSGRSGNNGNSNQYAPMPPY